MPRAVLSTSRVCQDACLEYRITFVTVVQTATVSVADQSIAKRTP